ncbi:MAG: SDR family oxidoreductase [Candidatus Sericytochromatia bacterium]
MNTRNILLAGASGALGKEVLSVLKAQGHFIRAIGRSRHRLDALSPRPDETFIADALNRQSLAGCCEGIDCVISCLGASVAMQSAERRSYLEVDVPANLNLIQEAQAAGVSRFIYVSLWIESGYEANGYVQAHRQVEAELARSGLDYSIVRPTGLYSAMNEFLSMARAGAGMLPGGGSSRSNPVHEADVAQVIAELLEAGPKDVGVGGPEVLSRRQILELAFASLGRKPRLFSMPAAMMGMMAGLIRPFDGRTSDLMRFFAQVATTDCVAPTRGSQKLEDYFRQQTKSQAK